MQISKEASQRIRNMSVVCAMLVVAIHIGWPHDEICFTWFVYNFITCGIARIAVPFFFVVSGYFLSAHFQEEGWYCKEVGKRIYSLVIPFFLWGVVAFVSVMPLSIIADLIAHRPFGTNIQLGDGRWIHMLGFDVDRTPGLTPLWYVRCLFFFVLFAPMFKFLVFRFKGWWLGVAFLVALIYNSIRIPTEFLPEGEHEPFWSGFLSYGLSLSGIFYFSVGIYIRNLEKSFNNKRVACFCGIMGMFLICVKSYLYWANIRCPISLEYLSIPLLLYFVWCFMPMTKWPSWLTGCSFSIFLLHCILIGYCGVILKHLPVGAQISKVITCCGAIIGSILITNIIRWASPAMAKIIFAGRS